MIAVFFGGLGTGLNAIFTAFVKDMTFFQQFFLFITIVSTLSGKVMISFFVERIFSKIFKLYI
jgi:hypothetical protein